MFFLVRTFAYLSVVAFGVTVNLRDVARIDNPAPLGNIPVPTCVITKSANSAWINVPVVITFRVNTNAEWADTAVFEGAAVNPAIVTAISYSSPVPTTKTFTGSVTGPGGTSNCVSPLPALSITLPPPPTCFVSVTPTSMFSGCGVSVPGSAQPFLGTQVAAVTFAPTGIGPATLGIIHTPYGNYPVAPAPGAYPIGLIPPGAPAASIWATISGPGGATNCGPVALGTNCNHQKAYMRPGTTTLMQPKNNPPTCDWWAKDTGSGKTLNRGCNDGCFDPDARIKLEDGSERPAREITEDDVLWNPNRKLGMLIKNIVVGPEFEELVEIRLENKSLQVTTKHPMLTRRGLVQAAKLTKKDFVLGEDRVYHRIKGLRRMEKKQGQVVYNFELLTNSKNPDDHMISAGGIATGDYYLQKQLDRETVHP